LVSLKLGKVSQRSAEEHLGRRSGHFCGGGIGIDNFESFGVRRIFQA
jgi:hypothetical protein